MTTVSVKTQTFITVLICTTLFLYTGTLTLILNHSWITVIILGFIIGLLEVFTISTIPQK